MEYPTQVERIAQSLVRIPSVNPSYDPRSTGEIEVTRWLADWGYANGFDTRMQPVLGDRSNVIFTLRRGTGGSHLLFNGHTDTVAVEGMTIAPFEGAIRDDRLHGRGSADMKGPLACMLAMLLVLRDTSQPWHGAVTVAAVVDEEYRFRGITRFLEDAEPFDAAIVGEPTRLRVIRGCKGALRFNVTTRGRSAHSSRPSEGANAIVAMARVVTRLDEFFSSDLSLVSDSDFGPSTGSIGLIEGGTGINIVPERCEISIDVRLLPGQEGFNTHERISSVLYGLSLPGGTHCEVGPPLLSDPGFAISANAPFVRAVLRILRQPTASVVAFSCDASKIALRGIPTLVLGPGDIAHAHTADESISLEELRQGLGAYSKIALDFLGT